MNFEKIFAGTDTYFGRLKQEREIAAAQSAGFISPQAQQQNRTLRNTIDTRSTLSGVSWKDAEGAYSKKFGSAANLTNNQNLQWIYDYMGSGAAQPAGGGGGAPAPGPKNQGVSSINFDKQLADIKAQNQASIDALTSQLTDQKADYEAKEIAANKRISNLSSTVANAQSQYDPTKDLGSSNNINPALTIQEKNRSLSSGTQRYNRSKLSINNLNV